MTRVTIFPVLSPDANAYTAISGDQQFFGNTAGEALDALTGQLGTSQTSTMIIVQHMQPDRFFSTKQLDKLQKLMIQWRSTRDQGTSLSTSKQSELESLVEAELFASAERTKQMISELKQ